MSRYDVALICVAVMVVIVAFMLGYAWGYDMGGRNQARLIEELHKQNQIGRGRHDCS